VLAAGRELARAGFRPTLFRLPGRPFPRSVGGPWDWPPVARRERLAVSAPSALTVSAAWGISAAPSRAGALGRGGPWEPETTAVETAYGPSSTLHVSLEEFARTLTSSDENRERLREGGVRYRAMTGRLAQSQRAGELARFRTAFRTYRAFDRPNVLHLFATLRPDPRFAREFPEAVQTGPLWPRSARPRPGPPTRGKEWVWYASPSSAEAIASEVVRGLNDVAPSIRLFVRTGRPWSGTFPRDRVEVAAGPMPPNEWRRRFARADLRIVTGSRTLLEAMEHGGPFLYFNGVLDVGVRRRRHRPEKIAAWLDLARGAGVGPALRRDIGDFARGRRVRSVVQHAARGTDGWKRFPGRIGPLGFRPPYDDAGSLLVAVARALAAAPSAAPDIVAKVRAGATTL
jgi:hypothetical protein